MPDADPSHPSHPAFGIARRREQINLLRRDSLERDLGRADETLARIEETGAHDAVLLATLRVGRAQQRLDAFMEAIGES